MKRIKSALKKHRQSIKHRAHNRRYKSAMRTVVKQVRSAVEDADANTAGEALAKAIRLLDRVAVKGIIHKRTAARNKSRLTTAVRGIAAAK